MVYCICDFLIAGQILVIFASVCGASHLTVAALWTVRSNNFFSSSPFIHHNPFSIYKLGYIVCGSTAFKVQKVGCSCSLQV